MTVFLLYPGERQKPRGKFVETFSFFSRTPEISRKIFGFSSDDFFLENTCALCPCFLASSIPVFSRQRVCPRTLGWVLDSTYEL